MYDTCSSKAFQPKRIGDACPLGNADRPAPQLRCLAAVIRRKQMVGTRLAGQSVMQSNRFAITKGLRSCCSAWAPAGGSRPAVECVHGHCKGLGGRVRPRGANSRGYSQCSPWAIRGPAGACVPVRRIGCTHPRSGNARSRPPSAERAHVAAASCGAGMKRSYG